MKKIHIIITTLLLSAGMMGGCSDILDVAPDGMISLDQIFEDNDKVAAYLNTCYSFVPAKGYWYYFSTNIPTVLSDEAWDADDCAGLRVVQYYNGNVSAGADPLYEDMPGTNKRLGSYWKYYWEAIRNCSVFLERIDDAKVNRESDRDRWRAEAHILRAYYYFELLKWYGASFPVTGSSYSIEQDFAELEQSTYGEIVRFIEADCDAALESASLPWRITTEGEIMRLTKAVAEALKTKAVLYAISERFDDGTYTAEEAYRIGRQSLQNLRDNGYELFNKDNTFIADEVYTDPYHGIVTGPKKDEMIRAIGANKYYFSNWADYSSNPVDKETIWQHQVHQQYMWHTTSFVSTYKCGPCPTQEYVDAFEVTDGTVAYTLLDAVKPYNDTGEPTHLLPNYNPRALALYEESDPYSNRDPRFYATIHYHGSRRYIEDNKAWTTLWTDVDDPVNGLRDGNSDGSRTFTRTGYYSQKFLHPTEGTHDLNSFSPGWKLFRFGEMVLNVAELAVEAGHTADAIQLVNEIRRRSAMPEHASSNDVAHVRRLVRQERRVELGFEEARYYDVRRWLAKGEDKDLAETDKWLTKMVIRDTSPAGDHSSHSFTREPVRELPRDNYKSRYLLQPIPLAEATRLEVITGRPWQNPGW